MTKFEKQVMGFWAVVIAIFATIVFLGSCTMPRATAKMQLGNHYIILDEYGQFRETSRARYESTDCREIEIGND